MKLKHQQTHCVLYLAFCLATGCHAQDKSHENIQTATWKPDIRIVTEKNVLWGIETNHVKAGLNIQYGSGISNRTLVGFFVVLYNNSDTNGNFRPDLLSLGFPPENSRYKMTLVDDKGVVVTKTEMGKNLDQPLDLHPQKFDIYHGYAEKGFSPFFMDVLTREPIVLENYFEITNAGKYHLKFVLNTFTGTDDKRILQPFYLPVDADIEITRP